MPQHAAANQLIHESSPYLLQHAHNPVNWYPWGEEALAKAKAEDKLILVSIGYSACHWCHVMERESFENEEVAGIMNESFINIKIDREERPDLDHIYMDAVQAMTGSGGWPLNVFLTPDAQPFYGGTYFPPARAYNRASWTEVIQKIGQAWLTRREEIVAQASELTAHLAGTSVLKRKDNLDPGVPVFTKEMADTLFSQLMKTADTEWGGFGQAPKFPQTFTIRYLLQYHHYTGNKAALEQALLSLDKMLDGGIYDQVGGGLARYSTDTEWLAPHFEKMLYDNALFVIALCDAYALTRIPKYAVAIRKTLDFVSRELQHPEGGFYAALDADSEGVEGKFYVWDKQEVDAVLGEDAAVFCRYFDVTENGNWEGTNILRRTTGPEHLAAESVMDTAAFEQHMQDCLDQLLAVRSGRVRPSLDDKILLGWNALMITAFCRSGAVLGDDRFIKTAESNFNNILKYLNKGNKGVEMHHTYKDGVARYPAFLDDYGALIQACIQLQETTSEAHYLFKAKSITELVIDRFFDQTAGYFFYTGKDQKDLIMRKQEIYDGATASGNSQMAENLFYLGRVFEDPHWQRIAEQMTSGISTLVEKHPGSFGLWASLVLQQANGTGEIVITGTGYQGLRRELLQYFMPARVLISIEKPVDGLPLLKGKQCSEVPLIYWCKNNQCSPAAASLDELFSRINN